MRSVPYVFIKDFIKIYENYKICKENKKKLLECLDNYIMGNDNNNCNNYFKILNKNNCFKN